MERIFPLLGVRFISVNDGYDSGMQAGNDVRGLEVASRTSSTHPTAETFLLKSRQPTM